MADTSFGNLFTIGRELLSKESKGDAFRQQCLRFAAQALDEMAGDAPAAFFPTTESVVLHADVISSTVGARMNTTADRRVLSITTDTGARLVSWTPHVDGSWDGIMHLEVETPDGVIHRRQSLEWWAEDGIGGYDYYVSIDRPWPDLAGTLFPFRIHQPEFFLHPDTIQLLGPGHSWSLERARVDLKSDLEAREYGMLDYRGDTTGVPRWAMRTSRFQHFPPATAPVAAFITAGAPPPPWLGPVQEGGFRFYATFCWGYLDQEHQDAPGGVREPVWESAPSPVSNLVTHTGPTAGLCIEVTFSNPDQMLDFARSGELRQGRSGRRVRLYVTRESIRTAGLGTYNAVDADKVAYLLDEIDCEEASPTGTYTWRGAVVPDVMRRLSHIAGYPGWRVHPHQNQRYIIDFPVLRLPLAFVTDTDTLPIERAYSAAFLQLYKAYLSESDGGDLDKSNQYRMLYSTALAKARAGTTGARSMRGGTIGGVNMRRRQRDGAYTEIP